MGSKAESAGHSSQNGSAAAHHLNGSRENAADRPRPSSAAASASVDVRHNAFSSHGSETPSAGDKELAAKIASLEKQIRDASSEARKAPLIAMLNGLKSGSYISTSSSAVSSAKHVASPRTSSPISPSSLTYASVGDKEVAAKIASLEKQIRDANSEARKAPLIAMLNSLRSGSSIPSSTAAAPSPKPVVSPKPSSPSPVPPALLASVGD